MCIRDRYEACDSKMLEHQLKDFHQYVLRVRKKTLASANRGPKSNEEHEQIMEAIKAGNADLAEQLAHQHKMCIRDRGISPRCHLEDITRADIYGYVVPFCLELMKLMKEYQIPIKVRACDTMGYGVNYPGAVIPRSVQGII